MSVKHIHIQVCHFQVSVLLRALLQALEVWPTQLHFQSGRFKKLL